MTDNENTESTEVPVPEPQDIPVPETGDNHSGAGDDIPEWGRHLTSRVDELHAHVHTHSHGNPEPEHESHPEPEHEEHEESDETPRKPPWTHRQPWKRD